MKEILLFYLYRNFPAIVYTLWTLLLISLSYIIGNDQAHHIWKHNLKHYMPEIVKVEMGQRGAYIKKLEAENKALQQKLDTLLPYFKVMKEIEL